MPDPLAYDIRLDAATIQILIDVLIFRTVRSTPAISLDLLTLIDMFTDVLAHDPHECMVHDFTA